MRIRIIKQIALDYMPPVGAELEVEEEGFYRDGYTYPVWYKGRRVMILKDECEVVDDGKADE